jgi:hypothetical protein
MAGTGLCLALGLASFASSGHFDLFFGLTGQTEFQNKIMVEKTYQGPMLPPCNRKCPLICIFDARSLL